MFCLLVGLECRANAESGSPSESRSRAAPITTPGESSTDSQSQTDPLTILAPAVRPPALPNSQQLPSLPQQANLQRLIERLDHPSFQTRQSAARRLLAAATQDSDAQRVGLEAFDVDGVMASLQAAQRHESLEVRLASGKLLEKISLLRHERQLARLLNPRCDAKSIQLSMWHDFSSLAGNDMQARTSFAPISRRLYLCRRAQRNRPTDAGSVDRTFALGRLARELDPYLIDPDDSTAWMILLMHDLTRPKASPHLASRISLAMSHCPMGPSVANDAEDIVLIRLIDRWVRAADQLCGDRERLLILMRYNCLPTARTLCREVLEDQNSPAATAVTSLLVASALGLDALPVQALRRLEDRRVAHVWQLIPSRKTKIQTEVGDVALALLLHHNGVDPREVGYAELQADRLLKFRDHSLGFADEPSRMRARSVARSMLPLTAAKP